MITDDAVDLLDRQHAYLRRQTGLRVFVALRRYFDVLIADAVLGSLIEDLEREAFAMLDAFGQVQRDLAAEALTLCEHLIALAPHLDGDLHHGQRGACSISNARAVGISILGGEDRSVDLGISGDRNRSGVELMLWILHELLDECRFLVPNGPAWTKSETDLRPDLAPLEAARSELAGRESIERRRLAWAAEGEACFALLRLRELAREFGHEWQGNEAHRQRWIRAVVNQRFPTSLLVALDRDFVALFSPGLLEGAQDDVDAAAAGVEQEADLLHDEMRRRIGSTRSRLALLARFRQRCEWYDSSELRTLADSAGGAPESALTNALTRFLFDAGLNPITKPMTGRLEPDILDPFLAGGFYVEVKQYNGSARDALRRGIWQAHDTLATLRQTRYDVREGFYVVFRRSGPRYVFPARVPGEGWTLYPVLIDLAVDIGSLARHPPRAFTIDELAPQTASE